MPGCFREGFPEQVTPHWLSEYLELDFPFPPFS